MSQELVAQYSAYSVWWLGKDSKDHGDPLPFELKDVHDWYIKWDSLNVQHTPDSEWVEYDPHLSACDDHDYIKRPVVVRVDGEERI